MIKKLLIFPFFLIWLILITIILALLSVILGILEYIDINKKHIAIIFETGNKTFWELIDGIEMAFRNIRHGK